MNGFPHPQSTNTSMISLPIKIFFPMNIFKVLFLITIDMAALTELDGKKIEKVTENTTIEIPATLKKGQEAPQLELASSNN